MKSSTALALALAAMLAQHVCAYVNQAPLEAAPEAAYTGARYVEWLGQFEVERKSLRPDGRPRQVWGNLGRIDKVHSVDEVKQFVHTRLADALGLRGDEEFRLRKVEKSRRTGTVHYYFDQFVNGLSVFGGELFVHIDVQTATVVGLSANVLPGADAVPPAQNLFPTAPQQQYMIKKAARLAGLDLVEVVTQPVVQYVIGDNDVGYLGVSARVETGDLRRPFDVYLDATSGELLMSIPVWKEALYRKVYNTNHTKELPGDLARVEGEQPVDDTQVNNAYDNAGRCYNYYKTVFDRDSWDNLGSPLNSTVHYSVNYSNAFWNGEQMVYGDGDGVYFGDFTNDLSVICHEITHGITQSTANLRYFKQSGALNEAYSDILGGSSAVIWNANPEYQRVDAISDWPIGQNVTLFRFATRWMNNPVLDGSSPDYYDDRYTGLADNGGVHSNSLIQSLAYVLTTQGGVHPQQKTTMWVDPIGIHKSQQIYYYTLTQLLTSTSDFVDARVATVSAAKLLYGDDHTVTNTDLAFAAVGIPAE